MSRRRRQTYSGSSVEAHRGYLHLRFRATLPDGTHKHVARATGLDDTSENRAALRPLAKLVGAAIAAGKSLEEIDQIIGRPAPSAAEPPVVDRSPSTSRRGLNSRRRLSAGHKRTTITATSGATCCRCWAGWRSPI
jgi:hypothetical protein